MSRTNFDLLGSHIVTPDYTEHLKKGQDINDNYFYKKEFELVHGDEPIYKHSQYKTATGVGLLALLTKFGFAYLGGMVQARRQFIYSPLYFSNHYFSWMKASKYMLYGYIIGTLVSTFTFGQPYLLEDWIRAKFRVMTVSQFMERGYKPM